MNTSYVDPVSGRGGFIRDTASVRPNIVFITYDMVPPEFWDPSDEARAAGTVPATPALDALRQGVLFKNAWCTSPLCSPSRAAFLTGRHSYITANCERAHDGHEHALRPGDTIFPEYLKASGYRTRHVGKCHVGAATFTRVFGENDRPWDRWSPPWRDDEDYRAHLAAMNLDGFKYRKEILGKGLQGKPGNSMGGWIEGLAGEDFPEAATYSAFTATKALQNLDSMAKSRDPFYLQVDFFEPHQPFALPSGLESREKQLREAIQVPASWIKIMNSRGPAGPGVNPVPGPDAGLNAAGGLNESAAEGSLYPRVYDLYRKYWGLEEESTVMDYLVAHILQFEVLERQTMRLFSRLKELGLWDSTVIVLCADHGEMNCEMALVDKGAYLNPRVVRVPLFFKDAAGEGCEVPTGSPDAPVSLLDIAPTLLKKAGISVLDRLDGQDFMPAVSGCPGESRYPVLFEVWSHVMPNPAVGALFLVEGSWYCYSFNAADPVDELYQRDPEGRWGIRNLSGEPSMKAVVTECRRQLLSILESDRRWVSWESYLRLVHRETVGAGIADMQRFVE